MTDPRAYLDQPDRLRAAATPGTWAVYWGDHIASGVTHLDTGGVTVDHDIAVIRDQDDRECTDNHLNPAEPAADGELIPAAVNALPRLTAALRAVLNKCDAMEAEAPIGRFLATEFRRILAEPLDADQ